MDYCMVSHVILLHRPGFETSPRGGSFEESGQSLDSQSLEKECRLLASAVSS
ncbi:hypothetical protein GGQ18_002811 [Salinibacter ruber]|nr:hypothetical protein [Salinibacter ruber]